MLGLEQRLRELLPERIYGLFLELERGKRVCAEELRLRLGYPPAYVAPDGEKSLGGEPVTESEIARVLDRASRSSLHSVQRELRQGYIHAGGGVRIGVCGIVTGNGGIEGLRDMSSLAIRLPHELRGAGAEIMPFLRPFESSVLIISPPGLGKTSFLRELIREASASGKRVCLCDERGEVAALWRGRASFELGEHTDILSGAAKAEGIMMLLRAMNPQIIALDEISAAADAKAIEQAAYCGCAIFATAHGRSLEQLRRHRHYAELLELGVFEKAVIISGGQRRSYEAVDI